MIGRPPRSPLFPYPTLFRSTKVALYYHGHAVTVPVIDRGPYAAGREYDLTAETKRSEEHTSELQSLAYLVCRLLLEKKTYTYISDDASSRSQSTCRTTVTQV